MRLNSTKNPSLSVSFIEAVEHGSPGDGGLFMPMTIPAFSKHLVQSLHGMSFQEIAFQAARLLLENEIPDRALRQVIEESVTFPASLRMIDDHSAVLELFHGPTCAFKDFGARFMARLLAYLHRNDHTPITVLVATSGDTGSAVAHGFRDTEGVSVVLLYPSGKVAPLQELQLTTAGKHVTALEIDGSFDDCQRLVKQAFVDPELASKRKLTSANSINIGRLLPQTFYYFQAYAQLGPDPPSVIFSIPSGNLGNLTAGLMAERMGLPVKMFVAGSNINDTLPRYLATGRLEPAASVSTISSAMDVGDPSNLARIIALFDGDVDKLRQRLASFSFTDDETRENMSAVFKRHGYLLDPHTSVAWCALSRYTSHMKESHAGIVLSTAHPAKFDHLYKGAMKQGLEVPAALKRLRPEMKRSIRLPAAFSEFKDFLLHS